MPTGKHLAGKHALEIFLEIYLIDDFEVIVADRNQVIYAVVWLVVDPHGTVDDRLDRQFRAGMVSVPIVHAEGLSVTGTLPLEGKFIRCAGPVPT